MGQNSSRHSGGSSRPSGTTGSSGTTRAYGAGTRGHVPASSYYSSTQNDRGWAAARNARNDYYGQRTTAATRAPERTYRPTERTYRPTERSVSPLQSTRRGHGTSGNRSVSPLGSSRFEGPNPWARPRTQRPVYGESGYYGNFPTQGRSSGRTTGAGSRRTTGGATRYGGSSNFANGGIGGWENW